MRKKIKIPKYTLGEEIVNSISHGIGAIFSIVALILLIIKSANTKNPTAIVTVTIFGSTMVILYTLSCIYHALSKRTKGKRVLRVLDHCNVFLLVYGTYLPIALIGVKGIIGWILFGIITITTITGIIFSSINVDKYSKLEVICHLINGWSIVIGSRQLLKNVGRTHFLLLIIGGILYSIGAILYKVGEKKKYFHSIFHFFCLGGTILHFIAIYAYLIK